MEEEPIPDPFMSILMLHEDVISDVSDVRFIPQQNRLNP